MPLFTCVADYRGGTYISQVEASDISAAVHAWAQNLETEAIAKFGHKSKSKLIKDLKRDDEDGRLCRSVSGLENVWCVITRVRDKLMIVDFIQTERAMPL